MKNPVVSRDVDKCNPLTLSNIPQMHEGGPLLDVHNSAPFQLHRGRP